jgi:hypothetical protein
MASRRTAKERWAARLGFAIGLLTAGAILVSSAVSADVDAGGADVLFLGAPTGELAVEPAGPFLRVTGLQPGEHASGALAVTNQTGKRLRMRLRALPDDRAFERLLRVRVEGGPGTLFEGSLGALRARGSTPFAIGSGRARKLRVGIWLPERLRRGYQGVALTVPFELEARP